MSMFKKAVKYAAKGRTAIIGPPGAGKSYTMMTLARALAGPTGKIAAVDTEHGSLSKYADLFDFDVMELTSFTPDNFLRALKEAEEARYDVFCADSLSHFWVGKGGALEFVDERNARSRDKMGGWKDLRPHERAMVDAMIASPCHVVCTMRTKNEYAEVTDENGKKKRVKIGLAPVQREGLEYEFDLVGYMDDDNTFIIDKTRCPHYSGRSIKKPGAEAFAPFVQWLQGSERPANSSQPPPHDGATNGKTNGNGVASGNGAGLPIRSDREAIEEIRTMLKAVNKSESAAAGYVSEGKINRLEALSSLQLDDLRKTLWKPS